MFALEKLDIFEFRWRKKAIYPPVKKSRHREPDIFFENSVSGNCFKSLIRSAGVKMVEIENLNNPENHFFWHP
jgi:hypothetical protein